MKKHWLAVLSGNDLTVARIATGTKNRMKVLFLSKYTGSKTAPSQDREALLQSPIEIKNWFVEQKIPYKKLKVAISSSGLITRVIEIPQVVNSDLQNFIMNNIDQYLSLNINNYIIDYRILTTYRENNRWMMKVLLAALPRIRMEHVWTNCKRLGFEPKVIDLTADCLSRMYSCLVKKNNNQGDIAIVSVQPEKVEFVLLENGEFFLYSDVEFNCQAAAEEYLNKISSFSQVAEEKLPENASSENNIGEELYHQATAYGSGEDLSTATENGDLFDYYRERDLLPKKDLDFSITPVKKVTSKEDFHDDKSFNLGDSIEEVNYQQAVLPISKKNNFKEFVIEDLFVPLEEIKEKLDFHIVTNENEAYATSKDPKEELEYKLAPVLTTLSELLDFYAASHLGSNIRVVYLTGQYSTLPYLTEIFQRSLGVQTTTDFPNGWKPRFVGKSKDMAGEWQEYGSLYGLALRED